MPAKTASAQGAKQIAQRFESQKVDRFIRDFKSRFRFAFLRIADSAACRRLVRRSNLWLLLWIDESLIRKPLHQLVQQILDFLIVRRIGAIQQFSQFFAHFVVRQQVAFLQRAQNCFAQCFHRAVRVEFGNAVVLRFEPALQKKIA